MTEELEVQEPEINPLANMIDYITQSEFQKANDIFNDVLGQRVADSLDQEKVAIAQAMYSPEEEDEEDLADETTEVDEDDIDMEVSDEELEAAMADLEDEDDIEV
jgi:threonine synthase